MLTPHFFDAAQGLTLSTKKHASSQTMPEEVAKEEGRVIDGYQKPQS
jgi:hypothetical protein